jgi:hypothetical protein
VSVRRWVDGMKKLKSERLKRGRRYEALVRKLRENMLSGKNKKSTGKNFFTERGSLAGDF